MTSTPTSAALHPAADARRESRPDGLGSPENRPHASRTGTSESTAEHRQDALRTPICN